MRFGSLCGGIGGLDMAVADHYGAELAWVSEIDPDACKVLRVRTGRLGGVPNLGDLTTVDWTKVEPVDVLCAGYPCQPFSSAGRRKGTEDDRHIWPYIAGAVRVLRPRRVVLENVAGHLSLGFGDVLGDLAEAGFDAEWCCVRASDVGAPHQRERLFCVATDVDADAEYSKRSRVGSETGLEGRLDERVAVNSGGTRREGARLRRAVTDATTTDADGESAGRNRRSGACTQGSDARRSEPYDGERLADGAGAITWGQYEPAVRRWEHQLGRPAPDPLVDGRLSARFVEWMMGFPDGWVTEVVSNRAGLRLLGNAVVSQQARLALGLLEYHSWLLGEGNDNE